MEKSNTSQLELFHESKNFGQKKTIPSGPKSSFFDSIWNYEKVVISVIVAIAFSITAFCLGVEHGKRITLAKTNPRFDISAKAKTPDATLIASQAIPKQAVAVEPVVIPEVIRQQASAPVVVTALPETRQDRTVSLSTGSYTIQLASYKTKESAQKAARAIKKKGLSPVILSKGSYTILCVGNFSNKNAAQSRVTEFKKNYQSCYVRRL